MNETTGDLARRLAAQALDVCRHYLPNGRKIGGYWTVGDVRGAKGKSLYVRLTGPLSGKGAAGKWTDAATGEHGDLLDLIAASCRCASHRGALAEAQRFLGDPPVRSPARVTMRPVNSVLQAQRLFAASGPINGTLAERYLASRGNVGVADLDALRFYPRCFYRDSAETPVQYWPALIAAVTTEAGDVRGVMRTYLARDGTAKAPVACPRKALGALAGEAVRFGESPKSVVIAEGIETVLSVRCGLPLLSCAAALSAAHLSAFRISTLTQRLYIAVDRDDAGVAAAKTLQRRAVRSGVDARLLLPLRKDFNDDLMRDGRDVLAANIIRQLAPEDLIFV